jgi:3-phosphoshikimate 1-carboxyvinyltransferase
MTARSESCLIRPATKPITAVVELPGSKSYTNRALLVAALADGQSVLRQGLFSDDTRYMAGALRTLGIAIDEDPGACQFVVNGAGPRGPTGSHELFIGNSGTSIRFLAAYCALGHGRFRLDGIERMRERPIQPLIDGLTQLGCDVASDRGNGCPPLTINASGLLGGSVTMDGRLSSQYFTALLLVAPCTEEGVDLIVDGDLVSKPYIDLTQSVVRAFGADFENHEYRRFVVPGRQTYCPRVYDVEPDASTASYFLAAAALTGGEVRVRHLGQTSAQGDLRVVDVLEKMGCLVTMENDAVTVSGPKQLGGVDVDMGDMSDVAQTIAAIAPFAAGPVVIRGIEHVRHKETDRVAAVTTELRRLGVTVEERVDGWRIEPSQVRPGRVETYDDHRMAMSFAVAGLRVPGIEIANPTCVNKTFPEFFEHFDRLTTPDSP